MESKVIERAAYVAIIGVGIMTYRLLAPGAANVWRAYTSRMAARQLHLGEAETGADAVRSAELAHDTIANEFAKFEIPLSWQLNGKGNH